jgi:LmbE family N-acetylglucosaminyl deacetylase
MQRPDESTPVTFHRLRQAEATARDRVLVVAPHQDDEIIGCGGSALAHIQRGSFLAILYMTHDEGLTHLSEATLQVARTLGAYEVYGLCVPDGHLTYSYDYLKLVVEVFRRTAPTIVYAPHPNEGDREHQATYELVHQAVWIAASPYLQEAGAPIGRIGTVLLYEVWTPLQQCHVLEDITDQMEMKLSLLQMYTGPLSVVAYDEAISGLNRYRGVMSGTGRYVEAFQILRVQLPWSKSTP